MNKIISSEIHAILTALVILLMGGLIFNNWFLAAALVLGGYIAWLYYRLARLERWVEHGTKASEVYEDNGFIGYIIRHLYQQKKIHNKRKKRTKDILSRLNQNISALPDATVLLNDMLEIEWANSPAQYLLGINPRHDVGLRIGNLIRDPAFLGYLITPDNKPFVEIESPIDNKTTLQIQIVRFGSNQRLLTARNVSDTKQLQESLMNFVANASHELKSPLTVIAGHLEMLENDSRLSKAGKKSLKIAQKQSKRMQSLIQDLLLLSQVESYQLQTNEGNVLSIAEIMANSMAAVDRNCQDDLINCEYTEDMYLLGIKSEIEGICINLIDNAIKYADNRKPIDISWTENQDGEYVFSVKDRGPGISRVDLGHVTERYFRGAHTTSDKIIGSGLGLAIVQQAAIKHGATLHIDSELNRGSRFSVVFPSYRVVRNKPNLDNVIKLKA